ncbi:MAG TPA: hypothetical protein VGJ02_00175 [Pyrinomonadaceae bacterium]
MNEQNEYRGHQIGSFRAVTVTRQLQRYDAPVQLMARAFDTPVVLDSDAAEVVRGLEEYGRD